MNAGVSLTACPCYFPLALRPFRTASKRHDSQRVEGSCSVLRVRPEQPVPAPSANDGSAERTVALELACAIVNQARPVAASSVRQARGPAAPAASCQRFAGVATLALIGGAWASQANEVGRNVAWSSSAALFTPDIRLSDRNVRDSRLEIVAIQSKTARIHTADGNGFVKRL